MNKENCFKVAKNVWVDKEGTSRRKAYIFDKSGSSYTSVPIDFRFTGCFGRNGLLDYIKGICPTEIDYFTRKEADAYYNGVEDSLSDLDAVSVLTSCALEPSIDDGDEHFLPEGMTLEDFGDVDYYQQ